MVTGTQDWNCFSTVKVVNEVDPKNSAVGSTPAKNILTAAFKTPSSPNDIARFQAIASSYVCCLLRFCFERFAVR